MLTLFGTACIDQRVPATDAERPAFLKEQERMVTRCEELGGLAVTTTQYPYTSDVRIFARCELPCDRRLLPELVEK